MATSSKANADPKFMVIRNLTLKTQIVQAEDVERKGGNIIIGPWDAKVIRMSNKVAAEWQDDVNLASAQESGAISVEYTNAAPRTMPRMPAVPVHLKDPSDVSSCAMVVYGPEARYDEFMGLTLAPNERSAPESAREYMRTTYWDILGVALAWLLAWGPPDTLRHRVEEIERKLATRPGYQL